MLPNPFKTNSVYSSAGTGKEGPKEEDGELEVPENIIPNARAGFTVYQKSRASHLKRAKDFARIQGMIDGRPPYSTTKKRVDSNINWRDGEAYKESTALAYWSLDNDVQYIAEFHTDIADDIQNPVIGQIVSEEFDKILRQWDSFESLSSQYQDDLVTFGRGVVFWPDEQNWQFDVVDVWRFLTPERTRNDVSFFTVVSIEHIMSAQELYNIVEHDNGGKWNKEALKYLLVRSANISDKKQYSNQAFEEMQKMIRNGDLQIDTLYNDDILLVSQYAKEYEDGKISRGIFHPTLMHEPLSREDRALGDPLKDWLYFEDRQYESMSEAMCLFTFTPGERFLHGNKGIGHRIFNTIEGVTMLDNSLMDAGRRASTVLVRTRPGRGKDLKQIQFQYGGMVDVGEAEFVQNLMGSNLQSNVEVSNYFTAKLERNNNISGASMRTPDGKQMTLGEAKQTVTKEAKIQKNRISHHYRQKDTLLREIVRKMWKSKSGYAGYDLVKLMKERCVKRGVPAEFFVLNDDNVGQNGLPSHLEVFATRSGGSGSQVADQIETESMMNILPTVGERGRQNILTDYVASHRGFRYVKRYLPPEDQGQQPTMDDTLASIENNQLEKGEMVIVSPDSNHAIHAPRHIERMKQIAQSFNEAEGAAAEAGSQSPQVDAGEHGAYSLEEVDVAFQTLGPHFVRHLLFLSRDPTRKTLSQELNAQWAILANFGDKIANNAQEHRQSQLREQQAQQEQMSQLDSDERVKMREVEVNANIKVAKLRADIVRATTRDQLQYLVQRQRVSFDNEIQRSKAIANIGLEAAATKAKIQNDKEKVNGKDATSPF